MANSDVVVPLAAEYGRSNPLTQHYKGANDARNEWWAGQSRNDVDQNAINGGAAGANRQAEIGQTRGPMARENEGYAANEASGAGGYQQDSIGLARDMAYGNRPSVGAYQLQNGLNTAARQQQSIARGARGSAALATAGTDAAANTANLQQNAFSQGKILAAQDMATGRGLYGSMLGTQRDQDNARLGIANTITQANAEQNDKYSLGMGGAAVAMGGAGNAMNSQDLQYYQGGMGVVGAQSEAEQQKQRWEADARKRVQAQNAEDA